ncbi:MAG: acetylglutamate kinase [Candidatus Symbiobacter sp.]|nr:acetylglutamate kinase [Candidatus Symbiobacter sp.]
MTEIKPNLADPAKKLVTESTASHLAAQQVWADKLDILSDSLHFARKFAGKIIVIKYGGHAMGQEHQARHFAQDVVLLKQVGLRPIIVHGGGPQIGKMLERVGIKSNFIDGLRVTDPPTMEIVEMVLSGAVNKQLVGWIEQMGGKAIGLSGKDAGLIRAKPVEKHRAEMGYVGEPERIDPAILHALLDSPFIPVIAPVGFRIEGETYNTYNINADTSAGAIAACLKAERLLMLTDVVGVLDNEKNFIPHLSVAEANELIADGTITGGMIPKVETCIDAVQNGVKASVILDGRVPHALLLELFTPVGHGTLIQTSPTA